MEETPITTPEQEVKDVQPGTVEAEIKKNEETPSPKDSTKAEPETVPLSVFLALKEDLKELKHEIKESKGSTQAKVEVQGIAELAQKYPDVSQEFIQDMLSSATKEATKKIEEKYTPILEKQEQEKKQAEFDRAFDNLFDGAIKDNPDLPSNIDKDLIKTLALTPKYRNVPIADILIKMYGSTPKGKTSSENETRSAVDTVEDIVTFDKITPEQKGAIMADPKARQKYFDWLDTQTGR